MPFDPFSGRLTRISVSTHSKYIHLISTSPSQVFGLDFMIDDSFKVWFIEINTNPCLELSCPLLGRIIPPMVENAFRIAIDPLFPPPTWTYGKRYLVPEGYVETNRFDQIFDEEVDGPELRNQLNLNNMPNSTRSDIVV
jgi:hypothetical protein